MNDWDALNKSGHRATVPGPGCTYSPLWTRVGTLTATEQTAQMKPSSQKQKHRVVRLRVARGGTWRIVEIGKGMQKLCGILNYEGSEGEEVSCSHPHEVITVGFFWLC